jgi:1,2-diacylglycerol 3-beta-galactosyltransferase
MRQKPSKPPHILFMFSDTGGGHRSAAEAIIEALQLEFSDQITAEMLDVFKKYGPPPLDMAPELYPPLVKIPDVWHAGYRLSDGRRRSSLVADITWPYLRRAARRMLKEHPCDMVVSVHPLINAPMRRAIDRPELPFATVVTDMVTTHAFWYDQHADLVIVATDRARQRGLDLGLLPDKIKVAGQPVADRFCQPADDREAIRERLGWPRDALITLLVGGGEGMGPLQETAEILDAAHLPIMMVIVAGRNAKLESRLKSHAWQTPTHVYGFVTEMPDFMRAADILVSKAGPGTICEGFIAGLPIILYNRLPGQEDGNVSYVVNEGAGVWAPEPALVRNVLTKWIEQPELRHTAISACRRLARPDASRKIARLLAAQVGITPN